MESGTLWQRARFIAGLLVTVAKRALPQKAKFANDDAEDLIEAIMTGDIDLLNDHGQALATGRNAAGTPWFFIALDYGSLAAVEWFLSHGANPAVPDMGGRLPLEAVLQRVTFADEFDDHLADCAAIAQKLIVHGADLHGRTLTGERLKDLAAAAGIALS